jgi:hypothetical protein
MHTNMHIYILHTDMHTYIRETVKSIRGISAAENLVLAVNSLEIRAEGPANIYCVIKHTYNSNPVGQEKKYKTRQKKTVECVWIILKIEAANPSET